MVYLRITHLLGCQNRLHTKWFSSLDTWNMYAKIKGKNNWKCHPGPHQNQLSPCKKTSCCKNWSKINQYPTLLFFLHQAFLVTVILLIICITKTHLILGFQWNFLSGQGIQQYWHQVTYIDYRADVHQTSPTTRLKKYLLYLYRMSP